jgi:flavin reductase (DIM6/NTAB) family NADH-FMN oxidoreductase RutF
MPTSILDARDEDVFLVTAASGGSDGGMIAIWITQASMSTKRPRIVAVFSPRNRTTALIEESGRFVVHLLAAEQFALVPIFGLHSSRSRDKFEGLELGRTSSNCPIVAGTKGWVECQVVSKVDAGDRSVYLADIIDRSAVQAEVQGLRLSVAFSKLPRDVVEALAKKRAADIQLDDDLLGLLEA